MIEDVAVPDVTRTAGWVERIAINSWRNSWHRNVLRCPSHHQASDFSRKDFDGVFPSGLICVRNSGRPTEVRCNRGVAAHSAVGVWCVVGARRTKARNIGPARKRRFPVFSILLSVNALAIQKLKLDQMDVNRMRVLGDVDDFPKLGGTDLWQLRIPIAHSVADEAGDWHSRCLLDSVPMR